MKSKLSQWLPFSLPSAIIDYYCSQCFGKPWGSKDGSYAVLVHFNPLCWLMHFSGYDLFTNWQTSCSFHLQTWWYWDCHSAIGLYMSSATANAAPKLKVAQFHIPQDQQNPIFGWMIDGSFKHVGCWGIGFVCFWKGAVINGFHCKKKKKKNGNFI